MVSFYPQVMRGEGPTTPERAITWVASIAAGQISVFALLLIARRLWWSRSWTQRHPSVAVWTIIFAVLFGVLVANAVASPLLTQAGSLSFGLEHVTLGSLTLIIIGSGVVSVREHRVAVQELQDTQASLRASVQQGEEVLIREREETLRVADEAISEALAALDNHAPAAVAQLNSASEDVLRPLSHELALSGDHLQPISMTSPEPRWSRVLTQVTTRPLIAPRLTAFVMLLLAWRLTITDASQQVSQVEASVGDATVGVSVDLASFGQALLELAAVFFGTWLAAWLIAKLSAPLLERAGASIRWLMTAISVLMVAVLSQGFTTGLFVVLGLNTTIDYSLQVRLALLVPIAVITALVGLLRAVALAQTEIRAQLDRINRDLEWELARINQRMWDQRQRLAMAVHGPLRAALISSAMELVQAESSGDRALASKLATRLQRARDELLYPSLSEDPLASIEQLRDLWAGTCAITINKDHTARDALAADRIASIATTKVIEEACSNAITHGRATEIEVLLSVEDGALKLRVTNDGQAADPGSSRGLGTRFIDDVSVNWSLVSESTATVLTAYLPIHTAEKDVH